MLGDTCWTKNLLMYLCALILLEALIIVSNICIYRYIYYNPIFFIVSYTILLKYKDKMYKINPEQRRSQVVKPPPKPLKNKGCLWKPEVKFFMTLKLDEYRVLQNMTDIDIVTWFKFKNSQRHRQTWQLFNKTWNNKLFL